MKKTIVISLTIGLAVFFRIYEIAWGATNCPDGKPLLSYTTGSEEVNFYVEGKYVEASAIMTATLNCDRENCIEYIQGGVRVFASNSSGNPVVGGSGLGLPAQAGQSLCDKGNTISYLVYFYSGVANYQITHAEWSASLTSSTISTTPATTTGVE